MDLKSSLLQREYQNPFIKWRYRVQIPRKISVISRLAACFGTALALLCIPAHALEIRIKDGDGKVSEPLVANASGVFEFDAFFADSLEVILDEKPVRIKRRQYYQVALRDVDAEKSIDVLGAEKPGAFTSLLPALTWVERRDDEIYEPNIKWIRWKPSWAATLDRTYNPDMERLVKLAMDCANQDAGREDSTNNCYYFYMSWREFKVWFAGAARPVTIRLQFPGGC